MTQIRLISFGHLHGPAPEADATFDLRRILDDPNHNPALRDLDGIDRRVIWQVLTTHGAHATYNAIAKLATSLFNAQPPTSGWTGVTIAVGCAGGRHRAPVITERAADLIRPGGYSVTVEHRDITKPVVTHEAGAR